MVIFIILIVLVVLYLLCLRGRSNHPGMKALQGYSYAHRGLHDDMLPENSLAAFEAAVKHGFGMELDVHLLKDGSLAVIHDSLLLRTTGALGRVEDLTADDLPNYRLQGTGQTIPAFPQVLELVQGKVPLIVELKTADGNYAQLCQKVCSLLDGYNGLYCIESFDPRCVLWLKKHRPDMIRGQLVENFLASKGSVPWILKFLLTHQLTNFLLRPDFVAHKFADRKLPGNFLVRKLWRVQGVSWTLRTPEEYRTATEEGYIPIFENFLP